MKKSELRQMIREEIKAIGEAVIPTHITDWAKSRGSKVQSDIKAIGTWAKAHNGQGVYMADVVRTKGKDVVMLDLKLKGGEVEYDVDSGRIKVNGKIVKNLAQFKTAVGD